MDSRYKSLNNILDDIQKDRSIDWSIEYINILYVMYKDLSTAVMIKVLDV